MKLFGQLVRTVVNVVTLPVDVVKDVVMAPVDAAESDLAHRTKEKIEKIKEEAQED